MGAMGRGAKVDGRVAHLMDRVPVGNAEKLVNLAQEARWVLMALQDAHPKRSLAGRQIRGAIAAWAPFRVAVEGVWVEAMNVRARALGKPVNRPAKRRAAKGTAAAEYNAIIGAPGGRYPAGVAD